MARPRYLWIGPKAEVEARLPAFEGKLARVSPAVWDWLDIRAGEPRVTQAVVEQFVPQMINFDVLGGVNFRKGCYPGQEVVARSQYRGTIKRRTALAQCLRVVPQGIGVERPRQRHAVAVDDLAAIGQQRVESANLVHQVVRQRRDDAAQGFVDGAAAGQSRMRDLHIAPYAAEEVHLLQLRDRDQA